MHIFTRFMPYVYIPISWRIWKIIAGGNEAFPDAASYKPRNSSRKPLLVSSLFNPSNSNLPFQRALQKRRTKKAFSVLDLKSNLIYLLRFSVSCWKRETQILMHLRSFFVVEELRFKSFFSWRNCGWTDLLFYTKQGQCHWVPLIYWA